MPRQTNTRKIEIKEAYTMKELYGFEEMIRHNDNCRLSYKINDRVYDVYGRGQIVTEVYITSIWDRIDKREKNSLELENK